MADMEPYTKIRHLNREYRKAQLVLRDELERQLADKLSKFEDARDEAIWVAWSRDKNKSAIGRAIESRDWATTNGIITRLEESGKYTTAMVTEEGEIEQPVFDLHSTEDGMRSVSIKWREYHAEFIIQFWLNEIDGEEMVLVINVDASLAPPEIAKFDCSYRSNWSSMGELGKALEAFMQETYDIMEEAE
jgi:hypothetical protein